MQTSFNIQWSLVRNVSYQSIECQFVIAFNYIEKTIVCFAVKACFVIASSITLDLQHKGCNESQYSFSFYTHFDRFEIIAYIQQLNLEQQLTGNGKRKIGVGKFGMKEDFWSEKPFVADVNGKRLLCDRVQRVVPGNVRSGNFVLETRATTGW